MGAKIEIRPFIPNDQARAVTLILEGLAEHFNAIDPTLNPDLNNIEESYQRQGSLFFVAELNDDLVGTGALVAETEDTGRIVRVSVASSHRRMGIGRLITKHLIQEAYRFHFSQIVVETNEDWYDAIRLYRRCGFTEYDRRDGEVHLMIHL
jgi:ribosomal protein S18 acetylase RimI-like enzyme